MSGVQKSRHTTVWFSSVYCPIQLETVLRRDAAGLSAPPEQIKPGSPQSEGPSTKEGFAGFIPRRTLQQEVGLILPPTCLATERTFCPELIR